MPKAIIVGAGLSGSTSAALLKSAGYDVEIFEKRGHLGGNCFDEFVNGICVHKYGPHGFHTNKERVWNFLNKFTKFNKVSLRVQAETSEGVIPIPFNKNSCRIIGEKTPEEIRDLIFVDYSEKMWGLSWKDIPRGITNRLPVIRESFDDRYHLDKYQGIPVKGYTEMFKSMLEGITVHIGTSNKDWENRPYDILVYTGKIDEYYDYKFGKLGYRSLRFEQFSSKKKRYHTAKSVQQKTLDARHRSLPLATARYRAIYIHKRISNGIRRKHTPFYPKTLGKIGEFTQDTKK